MQDWLKTQNLYLIIGIIVLVLFTVMFLWKIISNDVATRKKYSNVVFPKNETEEEEFKINKKGKKEKIKKSKLKTKIDKMISESKLASKVSELYYRAGKDGTFKNLIIDGIKYLLFGVGLFFLFMYLVDNALISGLIGIVVIALPYISLISKIQEREKNFRNAFPYFLQTVAFVLKNGTNFSSAFYEVVHKQEEGVLKEIMLEVLEIRNINSGDDKTAFKHITTKMKIQEASEFVNVVLDNLQKGTSIADTFLQQAQNTSKILSLNKKKKISSASTKILLPILVLAMSIIVLFLQMF